MAVQALVLGFGGTGTHILTHLKVLAVQKYGTAPDFIKFLEFDTIADWEPGKTVQIAGIGAEDIPKGEEDDMSLVRSSEYMYLSDREPSLWKYVSEILKPTGQPDRYPHLTNWLHVDWLGRHVKQAAMDITQGAAQQRQIGRFAMFQNRADIVQRIGGHIRQLSDRAAGTQVFVWIVGSTVGGTGAGCMIDAAYMSRLAAHAVGVEDINVTGVFVLPAVYRNVGGISDARAYSLLRELNRVQSTRDNYVLGAETVCSAVMYDAHSTVRGVAKSKLFDSVFYLGATCANSEERKNFFTKVASAIDPFLDERSGSVLLEQSVNDVSGIASAFGAARIYIPIATFRQLFAWEQVKKCLIALTAFNDANGDVYFGSSVDRTDAGIKRFTGLYKMFEDLLKLKGMDAKDRSAFVANQSPRAVLNNWFEFQPGLLGQVGLSPAEDRRARLVYVNPFVSWDDPDFERVTAKNINVRTFDEHRATGHSETREASATRFADEMANILQIFVNREGGENSLETGRRMVLEKMTAQLADKVDEMVLDEMRRSKLATWDPSHREDGTPASRLWREIGSMIAGPVTDTIAIIGQMVADVGQNRARAQRAYTDAIQTLKDFRPGGLARMRNWVEPLQIDARDQAYQYARTEQMYVLLQLTQELLGVVKARLQLWGSVFDEVFMTLAIGDPSRPGDGSGAIGVVGREYLERLEGRLRRLATFRSARISCLPFSETDPDTSMQGFRDVLRDLAVKGDGGTEVGEQRAALAEWQVNVVDGQPQCILRLGGAEFGLRDLVGLHRQLFNQFSTHVENKLRSVDIFDFVDYLQARVLGFQLSDLTNILSQESAVLISTAVEEEAVLVYHEPQAESKQAMSNAIAAELRGLYNTMQTISVHTDRHSISLIRLKKPADEQVVDIQTCNADYLGKQGQSLTGAAVQDDLLYRAQVYHMFPHELEAWYIERWHLRHQEGPVTLAPRIVRLLEDPAMTQSLIRCLVTGAVFRNDDGKWLWKNPAPGGRFPEVFLTDHASDDYEDLLRAANTFCLQREDCRVGVAVAITRERAVESYEIENQRNGQLNEWMAGNDIGVKQVHRFLDEYLPAPVIGDVHVLRRYAAERKGMELLFRFYAHPKTHVGLRHRTELLPIGG